MIRERILQYIDFKGITKYKFYQSTGLSNGFLDKEGAIGSDKCERICYEYPDLNPYWLITGNGQMLLPNQAKLDDSFGKNLKSLPLVPIETFAGSGSGPASITLSEIEDFYVIPDFAQADVLFRVKGDSMHPTYQSGDIVACRIIHDHSIMQWGKVFVLHHREQGALLKRIFPSDEGLLECRSDNNRYPSFTIPLAEVDNLAMVIGCIKMD